MIFPDGFDKNNVLHIKLDNEGCFNAVVRYNGIPLSQGQLTVISLNCKYLLIDMFCYLDFNPLSLKFKI